jgi:predicted RNase H-like HicB family nuclease
MVNLWNWKGKYVNMALAVRIGGGTMKKSFTVVIEKDPESGWLVGEVVELPGCYSQAPDLPTLEANMKEAVSAYLKATVFSDLTS